MSVHILYILHNDNNIVMILEYVFIISFFPPGNEKFFQTK